MKGKSDTYLGNRDFKTYNGILGGKTHAPKSRREQHKDAPSDDSNISQIYSAIINAGKIILPVGIISSAAAAAYTPHSDSGHADMGDVQVFIDGYGSHGDGIRTPSPDNMGEPAENYKKNAKKVAYGSPIRMAGPGDSGGVDINDPGISKKTDSSKDVKKSSSYEPSFFEKLFIDFGDWLDSFFKTDAKVDAYANATKK